MSAVETDGVGFPSNVDPERVTREMVKILRADKDYQDGQNERLTMAQLRSAKRLRGRTIYTQMDERDFDGGSALKEAKAMGKALRKAREARLSPAETE